MDKPYYPHNAIGSIDILARTLGVSPKRLISIADKVEDSYTEFTLLPHPVTNKVRTVYDPKFELKKLQKRINSRIFELVDYPNYLQGGIKDDENGRDYIKNATFHAHSNSLISLDIKNFYTNIKGKFVYDVFKSLFKFPDDVSEVLTKLTTYKGSVPQGGVSSSYIANLIFFNTEYSLVSRFRGKQITYTRLLDDVTLSSENTLSEREVTDAIKTTVKMFTKFELKLNTSKTKVELKNSKTPYAVTGVWVGHKIPKARKKERRYIRQLVFNCEKQYLNFKEQESYHLLWNRSSGLVAKLERLKHHQAKKYRERLSLVLPVYDIKEVSKTITLTKKALKVPKEKHRNLTRIQSYNKLLYRYGILGRTHTGLAKSLRKSLKAYYTNIPTKKEYWHA